MKRKFQRQSRETISEILDCCGHFGGFASGPDDAREKTVAGHRRREGISPRSDLARDGNGVSYGRESGLWDTHIRTDTEALTKKKLEYNAKNLNSFDAVLFYTGGNPSMDDQQRADFLSFIKDDGKGFVGVHSASITWTRWPEYVELLGGTFDEHPWNTFPAPIVVEDPQFPGMNAWPRAFTLVDEIYQVKSFSRENTRVLLRLDASKLDLSGSRVHRKDNDFAVAWAKMYGKGRVFYSTLGHEEENGDRPEVKKMYMEAIKWALRLVDADVTPRPAPALGGQK